jgi:penicillin-binding protein A
MKQQPSWRDYQQGLKRKNLRRRRFINAGIGIIVCAVLSAVIYIAAVGASAVIGYVNKHRPVRGLSVQPSFLPDDTLLDKKTIKAILNGNSVADTTEHQFQLSTDNDKYTVTTTLDKSLQEYVRKKIDPRTARYIGIVATDPATGKVLAMASFDRTGMAGNLCAQSRFPAASIFKIITAAAAIERFDFNGQKKFPYNGRKHTLYKSQLKDRNNRYTNWVSLKEAFATSINPVFGKLGATYLKKDILEQYASEFGFNMAIDFELPLSESEFTVENDSYQWAEIASGFNRETTITPVHGALIAGTVANGGKLMEPFIIERISDEKGKMVYAGKPTPVKQAISGNTAEIVQELMGAVIKSGTCRKTFRGYQKDRILSRLDMGGKTGSIDNAAHDIRLDWFVGYAREKSGTGAIGISVFVAHEKFIGTRAAQYARMIFKQYFTDYFAGKNRPDTPKAAAAKVS